MIWALAYVGLAAALVVRFQSPDAPPPRSQHPQPGEPLRLVGLHHALFAIILVGAPLEASIVGGAPKWRWLGGVLFALGVTMYRVAGRDLGDALSPFVQPRPGSALVTRGVYGYVRHPMYLGQAMIAVGAPLTLGARWALVVTAVALGVLAVRMVAEDRALARAHAGWATYAARAKRIVPFVF
jgi:protein-S-isoprenylcysteine O-methyltransferase Ste14